MNYNWTLNARKHPSKRSNPVSVRPCMDVWRFTRTVTHSTNSTFWTKPPNNLIMFFPSFFFSPWCRLLSVNYSRAFSCLTLKRAQANQRRKEKIPVDFVNEMKWNDGWSLLENWRQEKYREEGRDSAWNAPRESAGIYPLRWMVQFTNICLAGINLSLLVLAAEKACVIVSNGATWLVTLVAG